MDVAMRPAKRIKLDLRETFPVLAGRQLFTLHASVFIPRSRFLTAQRQQPEWIRNVLRPIDLSDQNPNHFEMYMQLVYSGTAVLYERISDFEHAIEPFGTRLLFKNIPQIVDRAALREQLTTLCTQFGEIKNLRVSNSNKSYVEFTSIDACTQASKEELWLDDLLLNTHISLKVALIKAGHTGDRLAQLVWDDLIRIYLLTDKLQDARAMNQVMQVMLDFFIRHKQVPNDECVALAYKYTNKNDPLRILMRDTCVSRLDCDKDYLFGENEYPKAFIQDILEEVIPRIAKKQKFEIYDRDSHCKNYHEHNIFYHKAEDCEV